jgi:hypothetical protein
MPNREASTKREAQNGQENSLRKEEGELIQKARVKTKRTKVKFDAFSNRNETNLQMTSELWRQNKSNVVCRGRSREREKNKFHTFLSKVERSRMRVGPQRDRN